MAWRAPLHDRGFAPHASLPEEAQPGDPCTKVTGGGIFLSPLLLFLSWCETRRASGVAAVFILCNSLAGLAGNLTIMRALPADLPLFAGATMLGALIGTTLGTSRLAVPGILKALGAVLVVAGVKLIGVY